MRNIEKNEKIVKVSLRKSTVYCEVDFTILKHTYTIIVKNTAVYFADFQYLISYFITATFFILV